MTSDAQGKAAMVGVAVLLFAGLMTFAVLRNRDDLDGTSWEVESAVIEGETVRRISGTQITLMFDDGALSGSGGCNDYFGDYEVSGSGLTVGPLGSTQAFCDEPEGVSDQELVYLTFLQSADSFEINGPGDRLTLRVDGEDVLNFVRF